MRKYMLVAVIFCIFITNGTARGQSPRDSTMDNTLSKREKNEGWQLLFNGQNLEGWKTFKDETPSTWSVREGAMCSMRPEDDHNPDIITTDVFENFQLSVEWKISPKGNSGILYLVTEDYNATFESGPEYQLIDDNGFTEQLQDWQMTGANYAMNAPAVKAAKPPGQWNHTVIIVQNRHVEHWLNNKKVVEYELLSGAWKEAKAAGKWKDAAGYGAAKKGHIAFQASHSDAENTGVCFKNVKIKLMQEGIGNRE